LAHGLAARDFKLRRGSGDERRSDGLVDNLYMYGPQTAPLIETMPLTDFGAKPAARAAATRVWMEAALTGRARVAALRAPDFYGPGVGQSCLGDDTIGVLAKGKAATFIGSPDLLHDYAYVPDVARAAATLLGASDSAFGQAWHVPCAPTRTTRQILEIAAEALGAKLRIHELPAWLLRPAGMFSPFLRELVEMRFQWDRPYCVIASRFAKAFWSDATPFETGVQLTALAFRAEAEAKRRPEAPRQRSEAPKGGGALPKVRDDSRNRPSKGADEPRNSADTPPKAPKGAVAPPKAADAPPKSAAAPPKPAEAPPKAADAPSKAADAPSKAAEAPPKAADAPPKAADAPSKTADAPSKTSEAPPKAADAPPKAADAPPEAADAPLKAADAPPTAASALPEGAEEPPEGIDEPPQGADEPPMGDEHPPGGEAPPTGAKRWGKKRLPQRRLQGLDQMPRMRSSWWSSLLRR
jgi:hypothetical protein